MTLRGAHRGVGRLRPVAGEELKTVGQGGRLAAARDAELAQDVGDVHARRLRGDEQLLGDLAVGAAGGDQAQHVPFAGGQAEGVGRVRGSGRGRAGEGEPGALGEPVDALGEGAGAQVLGDYAGIAESFLYAGATAVVAPLWAINDRAARQLAIDRVKNPSAGARRRNWGELTMPSTRLEKR